MADIKIFSLGDLKLQAGGEIPNAFIAYKTFGDSSNPAIIYPTWYSGGISANEWLIGDSMALSNKKYYIIIPALLGNGESSSPSNTPDLRPWPDVTFYDNVKAQYRLVTEGLGVKHAKCVLGWSMGAGQTYQWVTQYPDFMDLAVPFLGAARTSLHNQVFLEGVKAALLAAKGTASGGIVKGESTPASQYHGWSDEQRENGLKALGRVYAGWGFSQAFYREKLYSTHLGFKDLEDFMVSFWESWALSKDPENMLAMLHTWQAGDCSDQEPYNKDFERSMKGIKAKTLVLPGQTDLYFPPEDSEIEVKNMSPGVGKCVVVPSIWGHWAGGPGDSKEDVKWLDDKLKAFLEDVTITESSDKPYQALQSYAAGMSPFPSFTLTPEEQTSFQTDLLDLIASIQTIISGPSPLSVYDWSEALRLVRDAFAFAADIHELGPESATRLATLFLYKGDCFQGLGRIRESRDAYLAACRVECVGAEDRGFQYLAGDRLEDLEDVVDDFRAKRLGGLWNALNTRLNDPDLSVLGYETELWDPEPPLLVKSVAHRPLIGESRVMETFYSLKAVMGGFVGVKTLGLRSRKRQSVATIRMVQCAA
ncbi:hypothetical protein SCUP234_05431 [Seiridium cupressi]